MIKSNIFLCFILFLSILVLQINFIVPINHECFIKEELPIGSVISNVLNDVLPKIIDLNLLKYSSILLPHHIDKTNFDDYFFLKIVNVADPYVDIFDVSCFIKSKINK